MVAVKFLYTTVKKLYNFTKADNSIQLIFNDLCFWHNGCRAIIKKKINR